MFYELNCLENAKCRLCDKFHCCSLIMIKYRSKSLLVNHININILRRVAPFSIRKPTELKFCISITWSPQNCPLPRCYAQPALPFSESLS